MGKRSGRVVPLPSSGGSKNFEGGEEDNLSAPSSFITNAHGKRRLLEEKNEPIGGGRPPLNPPLLPSLATNRHLCFDQSFVCRIFNSRICNTICLHLELFSVPCGTC